MNASNDRPLTRGEETALLLACIFLTPLVAVIAYFWWRDSSPQRASSVTALARWFFTIVLIVTLAAVAFSFISQLLHH